MQPGKCGRAPIAPRASFRWGQLYGSPRGPRIRLATGVRHAMITGCQHRYRHDEPQVLPSARVLPNRPTRRTKNNEGGWRKEACERLLVLGVMVIRALMSLLLVPSASAYGLRQVLA